MEGETRATARADTGRFLLKIASSRRFRYAQLPFGFRHLLSSPCWYHWWAIKTNSKPGRSGASRTDSTVN